MLELGSLDILAPIFAGVGAVFGVAIGISGIAKGTMKGISITKDLEVRKQITQVAILTSALVEGVALFATVAIVGVIFNLDKFMG